MEEKNMVRALSEDGGVVFCGVDSTALVQRMEQIHHTGAVASAALGRLLTAASMMGIMLKSPDDSITLRVKGDGPLGMLIAVTDGMGCVKGCVSHPLVDLPPRADGHLDVGTAVGRNGTLSVVRDLGLREPYVGQIPLVSGEIAEDITSYYATSEQIPSACALGVLVNPDLTIACAGGYLVQLLPGATDEEITQLENNLAAAPSVTEMLRQGMTPEDMMERVMKGFGPQILDTHRVEYRCNCSRERTERVLISLGWDELKRLEEEEPDGTVEVLCQFCDKKYHIPLAPLLCEIERNVKA